VPRKKAQPRQIRLCLLDETGEGNALPIHAQLLRESKAEAAAAEQQLKLRRAQRPRAVERAPCLFGAVLSESGGTQVLMRQSVVFDARSKPCDRPPRLNRRF